MSNSSIAASRAKSERIAYRVSEFAEMLGVSRGFIYLEKSRGNLAIAKVSGRALISREEADRYVRDNLGSTSTDRAA